MKKILSAILLLVTFTLMAGCSKNEARVIQDEVDDYRASSLTLEDTDEGEIVGAVLEEKNVQAIKRKGKIIKISQNEKFALFVPDSELMEKQNIMLRNEDGCIYAKVISKTEEGFIICFTSIRQKIND